ncbi:hypothetical protein AC578_2195 [Pseudocercospora eumusae]|uniref:Ubiquitinyl hydrolase 1 n=1 Tax=Pseudocercospora eumusae TaxID=321146 RepID=A0A139GYN3_9PEZI|nr:hypothetical protein AC578_2195 [Pseudocercospora eumusae]
MCRYSAQITLMCALHSLNCLLAALRSHAPLEDTQLEAALARDQREWAARQAFEALTISPEKQHSNAGIEAGPDTSTAREAQSDV